MWWDAVQLYTGATERVNGSFVVEEKPTDEFMSDMLPVDERRPLSRGRDAAAGGGLDDDDIPASHNGNVARDLSICAIRKLRVRNLQISGPDLTLNVSLNPNRNPSHGLTLMVT